MAHFVKVQELKTLKLPFNGWLIQDFFIRFQDALSQLCLWIYMRIFLYLNFIFWI